MPELRVLNLGAGVQSTALYLLALDGRLHFDAAIFADTQDEPQAVYAHLAHLQTLNGPPILVRSVGRLGDDLVHGRGPTRRFASIPAFTRAADGRVGLVRRQCTAEYKVEVVDRAIRRELLGLAPRRPVPRDTHIVQSFGISLDEAGRAARGRKRYEGVRHTTPAYPLLDLGWTRADCLRYLADRLPHPAPRSACVFCPFHTNAEWLRLKRDDPAAWGRAVEIDRALRVPGAACNRGMREPMFLHRSCVPLEEIDFGRLAAEAVRPMTAGECAGVCGV